MPRSQPGSLLLSTHETAKRAKLSIGPITTVRRGGQTNMLGLELIWPAATINSNSNSASDASVAKKPVE